MATFTCSMCGKQHEYIAHGLGANAPDMWHDLSEAERKTGCVLDEETCVIKEEYYFLKANLGVPLRDEDDFFTFAVWVSLSPSVFDNVVKNWTNPLRARLPPFYGRLATQLPSYPETVNLNVQLYHNEIGVRPSVILEPTEHPLALEQRQRMPRLRLQVITELLIHAEDGL